MSKLPGRGDILASGNRYSDYDLPDGQKPKGSLIRKPEAYRIHKKYLSISEKGLPVELYKTYVVATDGCIYERLKDKEQPGSAIFDWSRRWTLIGHVGPEGLDEFLWGKIDKGWTVTKKDYPGSLSRPRKNKELSEPEKINPQSIVDLIKQRQKKQQVGFNDKIDKFEGHKFKDSGVTKALKDQRTRSKGLDLQGQPTPEQSLALRDASINNRKSQWLDKLKAQQQELHKPPKNWSKTKMELAIFELARKRREKREAAREKRQITKALLLETPQEFNDEE